jgi:hypothetical protein
MHQTVSWSRTVEFAVKLQLATTSWIRLDVKDVVVSIDLNNLAILLDDKDIVVAGGRILRKVGGYERYFNVCGSENNEEGGAKDNDALGHEEAAAFAFEAALERWCRPCHR